MRGGRLRLPITGFAAVAGVVVGHWITYLIAVPGASPRAALLAQTGHGYWPTAVAIALVFGAMALAGTVARSLRRGLRADPAAARPRTGWERYRSTALGLAALQTSVFVLQEVIERLASGAPLGSLTHEGFLLLGIAVQILIAAGVTCLLLLVGRTAEAIGRALAAASKLRRVRVRFVLPTLAPPAAATLLGPRLTRAPPSFAG